MTCPHCGAEITGAKIAAMMRAVNSEAQKEAARRNGAKGGRPRKTTKSSPARSNRPDEAGRLPAETPLGESAKARRIDMQDIVLMEFADGTSLIATTNSPASHYGIPAIQHEGCSDCSVDFGPADAVPDCLEPEQVREFFGVTPSMAAYVVSASGKLAKFGDDLLLTDESKRQLGSIRSWLAQWPEGPNL